MPTVFARRVWRKSLVKLELWRENKYGCERKGLTCRFTEQIRRSYLGVPGGKARRHYLDGPRNVGWVTLSPLALHRKHPDA